MTNTHYFSSTGEFRVVDDHLIQPLTSVSQTAWASLKEVAKNSDPCAPAPEVQQVQIQLETMRVHVHCAVQGAPTQLGHRPHLKQYYFYIADEKNCNSEI